MRELLPVTDGGLNVNTETYQLDCEARARKGGKISSLEFINQSVGYTAVISFGGATLRLLPGAAKGINGVGLTYRKTVFDISFTPVGAPGKRTRDLLILTEKFAPDEN